MVHRQTPTPAETDNLADNRIANSMAKQKNIHNNRYEILLGAQLSQTKPLPHILGGS